jgi:hypothetical protein
MIDCASNLIFLATPRYPTQAEAKMNTKLITKAALSLFFITTGVPLEAATEVSLRLPRQVPPHLEGRRPPPYFGISTYATREDTLILASDKQACRRFLAAARKLDYSLNQQDRGTGCEMVNIIEVRRFFLPNLLPSQPEQRLLQGK